MKTGAFNFWNKIKNHADIWFFFGFLLTFPLSVRKVLFFHPLQKTFNEYTGGYFYISDIFFICTILSFVLFLLCNNNRCLSRYTPLPLSTSKKAYLCIPLFLIVFSFISVYWSSYQDIALYRSIKLFEGYLIYTYLIIRFIPFLLFHMEHSKSNQTTNVPRGTITAPGAPLNTYFSFEKNSWNKLWLIYAALFMQIMALLFTFSKSATLGLLVVFILIVIENKCSTWNIGLWHIKKLIGLAKDQIVPYETIGNNSERIITPTSCAKKCSTWNIFMKIIVFLGSAEAIIAICQFIIQHSIGLLWLKESIISPAIPGVAKIIINGHKYIRAYGLFPHPNILGGFLLFTIAITALYKKQLLFHVEHSKSNQTTNVPRGTITAPGAPLNTYFSFEKNSWNKLWLIYAALFMQIMALLFTFSKSATLGLLVVFILIVIENKCSTWNIGLWHIKKLIGLAKDQIVPYETIGNECLVGEKTVNKRVTGESSIFEMFHVEHFKKIALAIFILIILLFLIKPDFNTIFLKSLGERAYYLDISYAIIQNSLFFGLGNGQFVLSLPFYEGKSIEIWQFQPVHNVFLLIWSELGIIGLSIFIWLFWKLFHVEHSKSNQTTNVPRGTITAPGAPLNTYFSFEKNSWNKLWLIYAALFMQIMALLFTFSKSATLGLLVVFILIVIENKCSTWNIGLWHIKKLLDKISLSTIPVSQTSQSVSPDNSILCNDVSYLSIRTTLHYFQGILLGFVFIMLFDHYFWDIWPGQVMLWLVMGIIAGIKASLDKRLL